jgi:hypothetical protein
MKCQCEATILAESFARSCERPGKVKMQKGDVVVVVCDDCATRMRRLGFVEVQ